jgi:hypothetical protein
MRRLIAADIIDAATALTNVPLPLQRREVGKWLCEAHCAHVYRRRLGRFHPAWGDGSLSSRARCFGQIQTVAFGVPAFLWALEVVLRAIAEDRISRGSHLIKPTDWRYDVPLC